MWTVYFLWDEDTRQLEKRYQLVAGHNKDGTPILFTCDEHQMKTIDAAKRRRSRAKAKPCSSVN